MNAEATFIRSGRPCLPPCLQVARCFSPRINADRGQARPEAPRYLSGQSRLAPIRSVNWIVESVSFSLSASPRCSLMPRISSHADA